MILELRPVTHQLDTLESTDVLSPEFMTYPALKLEFIRYVTGEINKSHYPVPAIQTRVMWGRRKGWVTIAERGTNNYFSNVKTWRPDGAQRHEHR